MFWDLEGWIWAMVGGEMIWGLQLFFGGGGFGVEDVRVLRTRRCAQDWCASCVGNVK